MGLDQASPCHTAADWFLPAAANEIGLRLDTPLRLKDSGHLVGKAPAFSILWARLHARITLAAGGPLLSASERAGLDALAQGIELVRAQVRWQDWQRYSARQGQTMSFGGLVGELAYRGELTPFVPWLALGEALGLGGKTTFGLGAYRLV